MSKYFYRIFTIIDLHFGAMQPRSSGLGMTLEASDFRSVRRLVAYSTIYIIIDLDHITCGICPNFARSLSKSGFTWQAGFRLV